VISRRAAVLIWIAIIGSCALFVFQLHIDTDMTAFLPRTTSPAQRVLVDQLRDGVVSRLVLIGIEGVPAEQSTAISKRLASRLRGDSDFESVDNGEESGFGHDRDFLWSHRYLLSDQVETGRFTGAGLRTALEHDLDELGSSVGFLLERTLAADPTGEMLHLIEQQLGDGGGGPVRQKGVWVSPDGSRSLMLIRLRAAGPDIDGAQRALAAVRTAFAGVSADMQGARLVMTGPPVFAVEARDRIKSDATRLSIVASLLVASALLAAYRSPRVLVLAFVPVVSGALAGIAAVGLVFRTVHGITLGFGATLIGEAVDYAVYLFTQTAPDSPVERTLERIWPTLRLGVLTSICGFSAMLLSSFDGFAQLGLFTITGLAVAVYVTRWVLPAMLPTRFAGVRQSRTMMGIATVAARGRRLRWLVAILTVAAAASLALGQGSFWAGDLSSLSPVPAAEQRLDRSLRQDMRAADASLLIVIRKPDQEAALQAAERLTALLVPIMHQGELGGFDSPARYLPSLATQQTRRGALPDTPTLQAALDVALAGLPFQPGLFAPFVADVGQQRSLRPISRADLDRTSLSLKLDSLLLRQSDGWVAMLSLRGVTAPSAIAQAIASEPNVLVVDLKAESDRLLRTYLREGVSLASLGASAIVLLLLVSLRSLRRLVLVIAPLAAAVVVTFAVLRLDGHALSIFNLFGVLLVIAIGSNYCLFFDRQRADPDGTPRVLASLLLANGCTVMGFGVLALSHTPVLHDLGKPVAIGTFLSLVFATIIMSPPQVATPAASARAQG
jgi:predicted exporter